MEAEGPLQELRRLHARLAASTKPRKLHKYLRRLSALPMTADLLAQTRVRKTVKALRRYEIVGSVARDLAAQWKKLARAQPSPGWAQQDSPPSHSRKRPWAALDHDEDEDENDEDEDEEEHEDEDEKDEDEDENDEDEEEEDEDEDEEDEDEAQEEEEEQADRGAPEPVTAVCSQPAKPAHGHKRPRRLSELKPRTLESPARPRQALPRSARPAQEPADADTSTWHEEDPEPDPDPDPDPDPAAGLRQTAGGPARAPHHGAGPLPEEEHREAAQGKAALSQGQTHGSTPRENQPRMSFEAYMTYDQLEKKQRKAGRPGAAALRRKGPQRAEPPSRRPGAGWLQKCPEGTHSQQGKLQPAGAHAAELQDSAPAASAAAASAAAAAAPSTQARDGPSHPMPSCPPRTKAPSAAQQEEDAGVSGRRIQSKMRAYAGARHATRGMTESPMCIPGLEPTASPSAGRGGPHSLPAPLPEQHTPEELQRVERDNPELLEETDPLRKRHRHRGFQGEKPAGQESWRQTDLRLQSAPERRLPALAAAMRSPHASSEPQGRQTKKLRLHGMPGPAGDAPGRQGALQAGGASAPRAPGPAGSDRAPSCSTQHSDSSLSAPPADRPAQPGPSERLAPWAPGGSTRKQAPPGGSTRKQAPKKIAPLMARSIRDYKNTLSRR